MAKTPKKMAIGGIYTSPGFIEPGGTGVPLKGAFIGGKSPAMTPGYSRTADDGVTEYVGAQPVEDINTLYGSLLGRAPDPTGIAANRGASADTIRQSILASPEYKNRAAGVDEPKLVMQKKGGKVVKKAVGGSVKSNDWHGFGSSKTGNNNHGF